MIRSVMSRAAVTAIAAAVLVVLVQAAPAWAGATRTGGPFANFDPSRVPPPGRGHGAPVARVFDRYIPEDSLTARGGGHAERLDALTGVIWRMLIERYQAEERIEATQEEVDAAIHAISEQEPSATVDTAGFRQYATGRVTLWKLNRSLHARYGGKVIYQQLDPLEPIGAYHAFLVEMEERKIIEIYDRPLRDGFRQLFSADQPFEIPPERVNFDIPWWLRFPPASEGPTVEPSREATPAAAGPVAFCVVLEQAVRFVFDPSRCESATNGVTGQWTPLKTLRIATVHLAGDFNGWATSAWPMRPVGPTGSVYVLERGFEELGGAGRHEFKFVVNHEWWVEPAAETSNRIETNLGNRSGNLEFVIPSPSGAGSGSEQVWTNVDPNTPGITRVVVHPATGSWRVHVWGRCHPRDCDWGENTASRVPGVDSQYATTWPQSFAVRKMTLTLRADGTLVVHTHTHFTDDSGRTDMDGTEHFRRQ